MTFILFAFALGYAQTMTIVEAATRGDLALVKSLLEQSVNVDTTDTQGRTALTAAVIGNYLEIAKILIDAGANPDIQDMQRNNALLVTGETGNVDMLREVLRANPDFTLTNRFGGTALIPAADRGHVEYVREILKTPVDVNHINNLGWTALLEAVILGDGGEDHTEIVRLLLEADADKTIADKNGVTPLMHAQQRGYMGMIELLSK
jgi:ankyrin repeat protein